MFDVREGVSVCRVAPTSGLRRQAVWRSDILCPRATMMHCNDFNQSGVRGRAGGCDAVALVARRDTHGPAPLPSARIAPKRAPFSGRLDRNTTAPETGAAHEGGREDSDLRRGVEQARRRGCRIHSTRRHQSQCGSPAARGAETNQGLLHNAEAHVGKDPREADRALPSAVAPSVCEPSPAPLTISRSRSPFL